MFHLFRHNFKDALRAAKVSEDLNHALTGHSTRGSVGRSYGARDIVARYGMPTLKDAVARVTYLGLDLSSILTAQEERSRSALHDEPRHKKLPGCVLDRSFRVTSTHDYST